MLHTHALEVEFTYTMNDVQSIYLIFILCSFNLKPNISDKTPDRADSITTFVIVYK